MGRVFKSSALVLLGLAIGGGAYAVASSSVVTISVCVSHTGGTLYRARTCHSRDTRLTWNQQGPRGPRGLRGPQGPGAKTFSTTLVQSPSTTPVTLVTFGNGLKLAGECRATGQVELDIEPVGSDTTQTSGTASTNATAPIQFDSTSGGEKSVGASTSVDFNLIARDGTTDSKFVRIDAHGDFGSPCTFYGMITPSS